jgi:hypothetical protein
VPSPLLEAPDLVHIFSCHLSCPLLWNALNLVLWN